MLFFVTVLIQFISISQVIGGEGCRGVWHRSKDWLIRWSPKRLNGTLNPVYWHWYVGPILM